MTEHDIQNAIRAAISAYAVVFRVNVGKVKTADGRYFDTGLPPGFSDLFGIRFDGRPFFIECKRPGKRPSLAQQMFLKRMRELGALTGIATSVEEAIEIVRF